MAVTIGALHMPGLASPSIKANNSSPSGAGELNDEDDKLPPELENIATTLDFGEQSGDQERRLVLEEHNNRQIDGRV